MFGFVVADLKELSKEEQKRYSSVYCGICRRIRMQCSSLSRMGLSYDMAFLALLLMSLYEPEEEQGKRACGIHPLRARPWVDNPYIRYSADMNVALAYYKALDDYNDEHKTTAKWSKAVFGKSIARIEQQYPRQCAAMADCIAQLSALEKDGCSNPDLPAGVFGALMAELFVYEEDLWSENLRKTGDALGRFIYLADAAIDYRKDCKKKQYNPFLAMETGEDWARWEEYLVLSMARCTRYYERLPLVQDKKLLDNILYGGVWLSYRKQQGATKNDG